jgi:hypothetical protein
MAVRLVRWASVIERIPIIVLALNEMQSMR